MLDFIISTVKVIHIIASILLIIAILLQSGKGGGLGGALGGGATTVFGGSGGADFMVKFSAVLASIFIFTSGALAYFATKGYENRLGVKFAKEKARKTLKIVKKLQSKNKKLKNTADRILEKLKKVKSSEKKELERKTNEISLLLTTLEGTLNKVKNEAEAALSEGDIGIATKAYKEAKEIKKQLKDIEKKLNKYMEKLGIKNKEGSTTKPTTLSTRPSKK